METEKFVIETEDLEKVNMLMASGEWNQPKQIRKSNGQDVYSLIRKSKGRK